MRPYKWVIKTNVDGSEQTPLNMKSGIKFPISLNAAQDDQDFFWGGGVWVCTTLCTGDTKQLHTNASLVRSTKNPKIACTHGGYFYS